MIRKSIVPMLAVAVLGSLAACSQDPRAAREAVMYYDQQQFAQAAAALKPTIELERTKMDENYVINNLRYGSCALAAGQFEESKHAFYDAYKVISSTETNDAGRQLGAAVVFEGVKVWKGEPFERAMADYYQGMLYLMDHNYGNARAAFQESLFSLLQEAKKDNQASYEKVDSQFALGYFGLGFCNLRLKRADLAGSINQPNTNFGMAHKYNPQLDGLIAAVSNPQVNGLVFIDAGQGPRKAARGWYNEESVFGPTPAEAGPIQPAVVLLDGVPATNPRVSYATVDTLAMAQDHRWMDIDTIKKFKAVVGTGAMAGGAAVAANGAAHRNKKEEAAGIGIFAVGALLAASSQSDTRYWEMLPRTVYVVPLVLTPGRHDVTIFSPSRSMPVQMTYAPPPVGAGPQDAIFYFRLR